ncbi:chorismate synthase [Candidatus Peregrinibacteria bacterium]|nr:chorismate synthase [Candidatus Peregrinibacteria bacterium]
MAPNSFGDLLRITTFGESHGPALGVVIDGCPSGIPLREDDLLPDLRRRRPGQSAMASTRNEEDRPIILSGVFEGKTTGMPIAVIVENNDRRPQDYDLLRKAFRPGHADATYAAKYGHRDHRGGGRSSGRETVVRVIAGTIACKILPSNTKILGYTIKIGPHEAAVFRPETIEENPVRCADPSAAKLMEEYVIGLKEHFNSAGGMIEIRVTGTPPNLGDPVFGKLKARLADALMGIGAVTGFSYGSGFDAAAMTGVDYISDRKHFGGILGGISTGEDLILHISVKPPSSLGEVAKRGRHDACIVPRVIPVAEAMVAIVLADCYLLQRAYDNFSDHPSP